MINYDLRLIPTFLHLVVESTYRSHSWKCENFVAIFSELNLFQNDQPKLAVRLILTTFLHKMFLQQKCVNHSNTPKHLYQPLVKISNAFITPSNPSSLQNIRL